MRENARLSKQFADKKGVLEISFLGFSKCAGGCRSTLMVILVIVCVHGAFKVPEDLFLDEHEPALSFLSFLGSGAPQPAIVSHVGDSLQVIKMVFNICVGRLY
ncbi:hypothetical protein SUGI_1158610 [Cryptomeria japonica]|nr:hypothetical protein SUGI_1158610 [Cryptomeria japonica]